jgi:hypothetical protein
MLAVPGEPLCPLRALLFASIANTPPIANNGIAIARKMKIIATLPDFNQHSEPSLCRMQPHRPPAGRLIRVR